MSSGSTGADFIWSEQLGGSGTDALQAVKVDAAGNIYAAGVTNSFGAGGKDMWLVKLAPDGGVLKQFTLGGTGDDYFGNDSHKPQALWVNAAGTDVDLVGSTSSFSFGGNDGLLVHLDGSLSTLGGWSQHIGYNADDALEVVIPAADGGYVIGGALSDRTTTGQQAGCGTLAWVQRVDSAGASTADKLFINYGGCNDILNVIVPKRSPAAGYFALSDDEMASSESMSMYELGDDLVPTSSYFYGYGSSSLGAFGAVAGADGLVVAGLAQDSSGAQDGYILSIEPDGGAVRWAERCGTPGNDVFSDIVATSDGNYLVAGTGTDASSNSHAWVAKFAPDGTMISQWFFAGPNAAEGLAETPTHEYVVVGSQGGHGWVAKLDSNGLDTCGTPVSSPSCRDIKSALSVSSPYNPTTNRYGPNEQYGAAAIQQSASTVNPVQQCP